jgi:hypothetical protein
MAELGRIPWRFSRLLLPCFGGWLLASRAGLVLPALDIGLERNGQALAALFLPAVFLAAALHAPLLRRLCPKVKRQPDWMCGP